MGRSAYLVLKEAEQKGLNSEETKALLIKEGIIKKNYESDNDILTDKQKDILKRYGRRNR